MMWPSRRIVALAASAAVSAVFVVSQHDPSPESADARPCPSTAVVRFSESRYPNVSDHIRDTQAGRTEDGRVYPKTLRIRREGADRRRARLLGWWERRHPQPKGDGLDLDESPAAVVRASWRASVRPVPQSENRSAGASLGAQLRGHADGTCVVYRFTR